MLALFFEMVVIVLPVFLVVGVGYGVKRSTIVDEPFLFQLNKLVYYLALPLLLFYKIASSDFDMSFNAMQVAGLAMVIGCGFLLSYGFGILAGYPADVRGTFCQCSFRGNLAYVGLAIVYNGYGESGLASAGLLLGCIVPVLNFLSILALLLPHQGRKIQPRLFVQQIVYNPLIIASFLGFAWSFFALPIPEVIDKALQIITGMALPLALLSIGASFSIRKLRGDLRIAFIATTIKLLLLPLIAALILPLLGVTGEDLAVAVLLAGTPTATAAYIFTQQMKGDAELSGSIIMLTTLLSAVSFTVILMVLN